MAANILMTQLSDRNKQRQIKRINRAMIGLGIFSIGWLVAILSAIFDISSIKLTYVLAGVSVSCLMQVVLLYVLKTNKNLKFSDPNLTTLQLLNAIFWVSLAMILMPQVKDIIVFFSFVCLLYSVYHTSKMALYLLPIVSIIGLALADYAYYIYYPEKFNFQYEALGFAVFSLSTIWISRIANFSLILRNQLKQQRQEIIKTNQLLAIQNEQDALTGLKNRRYFNEKFDVEYKRAIRNNTSLSLIMIDLDHFKSVNDLYGHDAGDECLKFFATLITKQITRAGDLLARYGGEEFVILLPNTQASQAFQFASQLKNSINESVFNYQNSTKKVMHKLTASFGVSGYNEQNVITQDELLISADKALYLAKDLGRNQVQLYRST